MPTRRARPGTRSCRRSDRLLPPAGDEHARPATREEHIARRGRNAVAACLADGGDPRAEGLGEHGSLVGGVDKPIRHANHSTKLEYAQPWTPLSLSWFSCPKAMTPPPGGPPADHPLLDLLIGTHLAGDPDRPTGEELARIFRTDTPGARDRFILYHVLGCLDPWRLPRLLLDERLSIFEVARAIHFSRIRRPQVMDWLHVFAVSPERQGHEAGGSARRGASPPPGEPGRAPANSDGSAPGAGARVRTQSPGVASRPEPRRAGESPPRPRSFAPPSRCNQERRTGSAASPGDCHGTDR